MIGYIQGIVLFSDGAEVIVGTSSGVGYQVFYNKVLIEESKVFLYISHKIRENGQDLYGFQSLREKKLFEMLTKVKGVGPKSAYSLLTALGPMQVIEAISMGNKKILSKAPGVGAKSAAQIILDLSDRIHKVKMYSDYKNILEFKQMPDFEIVTADIENLSSCQNKEEQICMPISDLQIMDEALMACKELGFKEERIAPLAQKILQENKITKAEQLVHLVLKGI